MEFDNYIREPPSTGQTECSPLLKTLTRFTQTSELWVNCSLVVSTTTMTWKLTPGDVCDQSTFPRLVRGQVNG